VERRAARRNRLDRAADPKTYVNISILTYGSRGDVQPYLALAVGLQKQGYHVTLAGPQRFTDLAGEYEISFAPLAGDPEEISKRFNDAGQNGVKMVRVIGEYVNSVAVDVARGAFAACENADLIVHSFLFTTGAHSFARKRNIPDISIQTFPIFASTRKYPPVAMPSLPAGALSYFGHWLNTQIFWYGGNSGYYQKQKQHPDIFSFDLAWPFADKPPYPPTPLLFAVSPTVLPPAPEWTNRARLTGYLFLEAPQNYQPPAELSRFLGAGPAPICVTFGSMLHRSSESIARSVMDAIRKNGQRAIILTGWDGWKDQTSSGDFLFIDSLPHDWLFPRCKAVIHHGGAGTTAASLRAGIPNIVIPFAGDQMFWGKRVHAIGAGTAPIAVKTLTAERLGWAIAEADDQNLQARACSVGESIRGEDGVGEAIRVVQSRLVR